MELKSHILQSGLLSERRVQWRLPCQLQRFTFVRMHFCCLMAVDRPLALRGHVTHKNHLTPEISEETHLREIFHRTLIFQQSSMICIGRHVGGHTLALQHGGQNYFLLISC